METLEIVKSVTLNKILFATDFSPYSEAALPYALRLVNQYDAKLYATHVLSPDAYLWAAPESWSTLDADPEQREQIAVACLEKHLRDAPHKVLSAVGDISDVLFRLIQDNQIDLLVLGTHGRTGLSKLFLGSVAEKIFRHSPIPVLTVGPDVPRRKTVTEFSRIVLATDLSDESLAALPVAVSLMQARRARLSVLHVLEGSGAGTVGWGASADFAMRRMREMVPFDPDLGICPDYAVEFGPAADQVLRYSEEHDADVIVLRVRSPHGGLGTAGNLTQTTSGRIVGHATCPVLTVRG
jgi:nucleotide-binding universal stress UspA family protein